MNNRWRRAMLLPLLPVLAGLVLALWDSPWQQALRNMQFDQFQRWHPRPYQDAPVRIVDIDEESLARLDQWPWPRTRMAELLEKLDAAGALAVGFDVMFSEPDRTSPQVAADLWKLTGHQRAEVLALPDHDAVFARSLEHSPAVLGFAVVRKKNPGQPAASPGTTSASAAAWPAQKARFIQAGPAQPDWLQHVDAAIASLPRLVQAAQGNGALGFVPDGDGVLRRVPLVFQMGAAPVATLVTESLRVAQGARNVLLRSAGHDSGLAEIRVGDIRIPVSAQGEIWLHYSPPVQQRYLPAWKVLAGQVPADQLAGRIVLIGSSAQGLMDLRFSPLGIVPGVEIHAQALEQILQQHFLQRPSWARGLETLLLILCGLLAGLLALHMRALLAACATVALLSAMLGGAWWSFMARGWLLDAVTPATVVLLTYMVCSVWQHFSSERDQRWIRQAFSRYVSPNRVAYLVAHPDAMALGGRRQTCSFVFTDLAGFTPLMEGIDPALAVSLLNDYLDQMIAITFRFDGTLDRIMGDALSILFSAPIAQPDHRVRALACALELDAFASAFARKMQARGIAFGQTRIGVHCGEVTVGNFGGSHMFDYRALGDPINTAARLESVNKHLGTRICISADILADNADAVVRPVGRLVLKGKSLALAVYEPVSTDGVARAPLEDYRAAFDALQHKQPEAAARFAQLAQAWPEDPLVRLHHQRLSDGEEGDLMVMREK